MAGFTARKQALHDFLCSTCVVRDGPAHVAGAITVSVIGIVGPMIAIPMFFMALFMGMIAAMFGDLLTEMQRFAPQIEIQVPAPAPRLGPSPKAAAPAPTAPATPAVPAPTLTGNPSRTSTAWSALRLPDSRGQA